jgi:hypothetical protein
MSREAEFLAIESLCDRIESRVENMRLGTEVNMAVREILADMLEQLETTIDISNLIEVNA